MLERHIDALRAAGRAPRTTYSYGLRVKYWNAIAGGTTVEDCKPGRLKRLLQQVRDAHGETDAKQLGILLAAALDMAIADGVLTTNPARAMKPPPKPRKTRGQGATRLDPNVLPRC